MARLYRGRPALDRATLLSELRERHLCVMDRCECDPQGGHVATALNLLFRFIADEEIELAFNRAHED